MRFVLIALFLSLAWPAAAADRIALVIGISDYRSIPPLKNTVNDASDLSETLKTIGFEVDTLINVSKAELESALADFTFRSEAANLALIYFAGHGVEVQGENFLIPVDAQVASNRDIQAQAVSLKDFLHSVDRARKMRIVILDSCRDNPFGDFIDVSQPISGDDNSQSTRGAGGLAPPSPDRGTLVAFAARDGNVALDGEGDNSPFALALMDKMKRPELEISLMFRAIRDDVLERTGNQQEPHTYGSLSGVPFFLASVTPQTPEDRIEAWAKIRPDLEKQYQKAAQEGDERSLYALAMMRLYPDSDRFDPAKAVDYLQRAAEMGSPEALYEIARLHETGVGLEKSDAKALEYYRKAAALDYGRALNELGIFHVEGMLGVAPDLGKAIGYFERAAAQRNPQAMFNLASLISQGMIEGKTAEDAATYLYLALRAGNPDVYAALVRHPDKLRLDIRRALQRKLRENAFYAGPIDGDFGPGTQRGLKAAYGEETG